ADRGGAGRPALRPIPGACPRGRGFAQARPRPDRASDPAALRRAAAQRGQVPPHHQKGSAMTSTVLTEDDGDGVRIVTLNRPHRLNAIVPALLDELVAALRGGDGDPGIRAVVLTGAGRAFCAGDDLKEFASQSTGEAATRAYIERIQDVTRAILQGDT